jgi:hypothetical protein
MEKAKKSPNEHLTDKNRRTLYTYKLFRVMKQDGRSTTVSVDPVLVTAAIKALGDTAKVGQVVREANSRYDRAAQNCSRSRFVQRELLAAHTRALTNGQATHSTASAQPA